MKAVAVRIHDPVALIGKHMGNAMEAVKSGVSGARDTVAEQLPKVAEFSSKTVYASFYYLSYGATYVFLMARGLIPLDNAMGNGLRDGAEAAGETYLKIKAPAVKKSRATRRAGKRRGGRPRARGASAPESAAGKMKPSSGETTE
ncbi:MAG: hypothetical protein NTV79_02450 [Candidatus Aureabacteria bacterium]|nr:hypothetical protein [Candidatus Auribacterota bacterium]